MSFYVSSPIPTSDPVAPQNPPAAWPTALDQLILQQQQQQQQHQSTSMGDLRRSGSTIAETLPTELPNYASPVDTDRLLLDSFGNQELRRNMARQVAQNQINTSVTQPNVNNYQQTWDRPGLGINGCNVSSLPQEAYQLSNELNLNNAAVEDFASRNRYPQPMGLGPYVERLMKFHEEQQRPAPNGTLENFWRPLFARYFASNATMQMEIKSQDQELRLMKLPVETLPRIWKSKFDAGVHEERLLMENPCEWRYTNGYVVVDCRKTVILTKYEQSTVITNGHLQVQFYRHKKIMQWNFYSRNHQEFFPGSLLTLGVSPPSSIAKYGIPQRVERLMYIAEDIGKVGPKIDAEISKLLSGFTKAQQVQNQAQQLQSQAQQAQSPAQQLEQKPAVSYAGLSKGESNGNAYRAMLSQLKGVQGIPVDQALGDAPIGNAANPTDDPTVATVQGLPGTLIHGLQNTPGMDPKQSMLNLDRSNAVLRETRDAVASWRPDQSGDAFPSFFEESLRSSFVPQEDDVAGTNAGHHQEDLDPKKQIAPSLDIAQENQANHSVIDAVAAVATGQGGWGVGSTAERNFPNLAVQGAGIDSLQLLNTLPTGGDLDVQVDGESLGPTGLGQSAPPGLSNFTPQPGRLEKTGKTQTPRRKGQNAAARDLKSSSNHPVGNGHPEKYNGGRSFQRMPPSRLKRGHQSTVGQNVSGAAAAAVIAGGSQGAAVHNGAATAKGTSPRNATKAGKDAQGATGGRRGAQRSAASDGREKRQKTNQPGNQT